MMDPIKLVQAYELLQKVRDEHVDASDVADLRADKVLAHGMMAASAELAADAVFNVLNVGTNHLDSPEHKAALAEVLA